MVWETENLEKDTGAEHCSTAELVDILINRISKSNGIEFANTDSVVLLKDMLVNELEIRPK